MATINAPSINDIVYSGECPLASAHGYINLAGVAIADKVRLNKVYAGTKVIDVKLVRAALGANTTVSLGFEYVNAEVGGGAAVLMAATATAAAGAARSDAAPVLLAYDAYITATIGGGVATGQLDVVTTYEFKGK